MRAGMISYLVTFIYHTAHKIGTALYIIERYIKRCGYVLFFQNIEYSSRTTVFITLVKGKIYSLVVFIAYKFSAV